MHKGSSCARGSRVIGRGQLSVDHTKVVTVEGTTAFLHTFGKRSTANAVAKQTRHTKLFHTHIA